MGIFDYERIRKYYLHGDFCPTVPSQFIIDNGDMLFECIRMFLSPLLHNSAAVLSGYYTSNLNMRIEKIGSFFQNRDKRVHVITYNMLLLEFAFDLFRFSSRREPNYFLEVFVKYAQIVHGSKKGLSDWLQYKKSETVLTESNEEINLLKKIVAAMIFVVLHEYAHTQEDLRNVTIKMFYDSAEYIELTGELSDKEQIEVACDFIALHEMVSPQCMLCNIGTSLNTSATDSFAASILMQHADVLFHLLKYGFSAEDMVNCDLDSLYSQIIVQLQKRCYPLKIALQITENTDDMSLGDVNVLQAYSFATNLIGDFIRCLGEALQMLGKLDTETIEKQICMQSIKHDVTKDEIWFRISLIEKD